MVNLAMADRRTAETAAPNVDEKPAEQNVGAVSFVRASDENLAPGSLDRTSTALDATTQDFGITDVPAYGFIDCLYLVVQATGGAAGLNNAVAAEDGPWNVLQNVALTEPNGAPILQLDSGFDLYLAQKFGGYAMPNASDPRSDPNFSAVAASGNFIFVLKIPVSVSRRDAVGALPNQDSAGQFKLRMQIAPRTTVYTTSPDTRPVVRVRAWLSSWDQPQATSGGLANELAPPAVGTTAYWFKQSGISVSSGNNRIEFKRKGNYLRQVIFVLRRSASTRANGEADWPDETRIERDAFPIRYYLEEVWKTLMWERTGFTGTGDSAGQLNNGVRFHDYMHEFDGGLGRETRDLWQATRGSTRLEMVGSFGNAATLDIIYNDVSVADNVFLG